MRKLIAGNWKMNGLRSDLETFEKIINGVGERHADAQALICPPSTMILAMSSMVAEQNSAVRVGGQTCHVSNAGAHTGDISPVMLEDAGASHVILGHSERRSDHGEKSDLVSRKADAALVAGLVPIICIGESLEVREAGDTQAFVLEQLKASLPSRAYDETIVIAYEPVWAIGTGLTASAEQIADVHQAIRGALVELYDEAGADIAILYGGSMKPKNASEILSVPNVNGGLIGGASLNAEDFLSIYDSAL